MAGQYQFDLALAMPNAKLNRSQRTGPRGPLVFDTRSLGPASARAETRTVPAPADLGSGLVHVPEGADLELDVQLEEVSEGVLVTATVDAPLAGQCARCLDEFTSSVQVRLQELFAADGSESGEDGYLLNGDLLDLELALRDALVLELPLSPLCAEDCTGLCVTCGIRLADAEPDHRHPDDGGVWAVLKDLFPSDPAEQAGGTGEQAGPVSDDRQENTSVARINDPAGSKEQ
jgi:uncharacterized protein